MTDNSTYHRTNINLYASDVDWLRLKYGYGWTEKVRELIHEHVRRYGTPKVCPHCGHTSTRNIPETLRPQIVRGKEY